MIISINKIVAYNFMPYGQLEFNFSNDTTQILGKNGQGKSAIYEALLWCFYGETARGIEEKEKIDVIRYHQKECGVEVSGYIDNKTFSVVRAIGANHRLQTVINGTLYYTKNLNIDQQTVIRLLGVEKEQFLSVTLLGHNSFNFNVASDTEMKKFINRFIDADKFMKAKNFAFDKTKEISSTISTLAGKVEALQETIEDLHGKVAEAERANIEKNKAELNKLRKLETRFKKRKMDLAYAEKPDGKRYNELQGLIEDGDDYINVHEHSIKELKELGDKCSKCGQKINKAEVTKQIKEHELDIKKLKTLMSGFDKEKQKIDALIDIIEEAKTVDEELKDTQRKIKELTTNNTVDKTVSSAIKEAKAKIDNYEEDKAKAEKELVKYEFWYKGFGNTGIIGYLTDNIINRLNEKLSEISVELTNGSVIIQYTPYSTSQKGNIREVIDRVCFINGEDTKYANLSNSEKQRSRLLTLFAFRELFEEESGNVINVIFFDEVFEGLDEENSNLVVKYINKLKERSINIMSHSQLMKFRTKRAFQVINNKLVKV